MNLVVKSSVRLLGTVATLAILIIVSYTVLYFSPFGPYQYLMHWGLPFTVPMFVSSAVAVLVKIGTLNFNLPLPVFLGAFLTSFSLGVGSILIAMVIGIPIGIWTAFRKGRGFSQVLTVATLVGQAIPPLVTAMAMQFLAAMTFPNFPILGWGTPAEAILPLAALSLTTVGYIAKFMQSGMENVLDQDYLLTARSHGLPEWKVLLHHALRPSVVSVMTFLGLQTGLIVSSTLFVEGVFSIPGLSVAMAQGVAGFKQLNGSYGSGVFPPPGAIGINGTDLSLPIGQLAIMGVMVLLLNLLVDIALYALDPRVRTKPRLRGGKDRI